ASVEFDLRTLSPTFRLAVGLPGRSNAFAIAKRLGLPQPIIDQARTYISDEDVEADRILDRIRRSRHETGRAMQAAQSALSQAREKEKEAHRILRETEQERRELLSEARAQLEAAQEELRRVRESAERQRMTQQWLEETAQRVDRLAQKQKIQPVPTVLPKKAARLQEPVAVGDTVWVSSLDQVGQVLALINGEAEVQVGVFRTRVPVLELEKRQAATPPTAPDQVHIKLAPRPMPGMELNLRGLRVEEALERLSKYLDDAYLAALPYSRIVHGKGTGAVRQAAREMLAEHPLIASFRPGELNEGGDGVTIVKFVPSR
ncbi:MAG: endonuclease MutS2, partial [Chloroflexi bacterium]|nr:endonuclease MutS2 [Chloroflexota bacterium]